MSLLKRIESARPGSRRPAGQAVRRPARRLGGAPSGGPASQRLMSQTPDRESFRDVKFRIQSRVIQDLDPKLDLSNQVEVRRQIEEIFGKVIDEEGLALTRAERVRMLEQITDEIIGLGPLEPLLRDESISEVMVNGPRQVYIERSGKLELTNVVFQNDDHVMRIIDRIIAPIGRRIDESSPMVDARLPDGSRVNAIIPPLSPGRARSSPSASSPPRPFTVDDLIRFGTATPDMFEFLRACVQARLNIIVSGGTGSGKTTMLNILSSFIPDDERIVTIEDAAELQLRQEHVVRLESRPPNIEGKGAITIRELVRNALRMRPDRIIVGECRGGEALDMLQAMNTGHDGSMTTVHANSPRDMLSRLETMVLMAGVDLPLRAIREQIASAIDLIVHQSRLKDGTRRITNITEVQGMEGDVIVMQDVFVFEQTGVIEGKIQGRLKPTGHPAEVRREVRDPGHPSPARPLLHPPDPAKELASMPLSVLVAVVAALAILLIAVGIATGGQGSGITSRLERYAAGKEKEKVVAAAGPVPSAPRSARAPPSPASTRWSRAATSAPTSPVRSPPRT